MVSVRLCIATIVVATSFAIGPVTAAAPARTPNAPRDNGQNEQTPIANAWPKLTEQQQSAAVKELKKYAEDAAAKLETPLQGFETKYFLFFSDLPPREAQN